MYHGLVDVTSFLELEDTVGVGGPGLSVFEGVPSFCRLDIQLNQRGSVLSGSRGDGGVLRHQLTTTTPEQHEEEEEEEEEESYTW